jgi:hypothetical protein
MQGFVINRHKIQKSSRTAKLSQAAHISAKIRVESEHGLQGDYETCNPNCLLISEKVFKLNVSDNDTSY